MHAYGYTVIYIFMYVFLAQLEELRGFCSFIHIHHRLKDYFVLCKLGKQPPLNCFLNQNQTQNFNISKAKIHALNRAWNMSTSMH